MTRWASLVALALWLLTGCQALIGALVGGGVGLVAGGPPGAAVGALSGLTVACLDVALELVRKVVHPASSIPPPPGAAWWSFLATALAVVLAWFLIRYALGARYREAVHSACRHAGQAARELWRAEGALHSREREP